MYYKVETKCGHVGKENYIIINFPIKADSKKEAAKIAREIPRVKHNYKDAILGVNEITLEEYKQLCKANSNDPYLKCKNKQEQNLIIGLEERIIYKEEFDEEIELCVWKYKKPIRNVKKYLKFNNCNDYIDEFEYAY